MRSSVILEDLPSSTLTSSLLGLKMGVRDLIQLVAWPTDFMLVEVDTTEY
jgi:hypothetical protein